MGVAQLPIPTRVTSTPPPVATRGDGLVRWGEGEGTRPPAPHPQAGLRGSPPKGPLSGTGRRTRKFPLRVSRERGL